MIIILARGNFFAQLTKSGDRENNRYSNRQTGRGIAK